MTAENPGPVNPVDFPADCATRPAADAGAVAGWPVCLLRHCNEMGSLAFGTWYAVHQIEDMDMSRNPKVEYSPWLQVVVAAVVLSAVVFLALKIRGLSPKISLRFQTVFPH